MPKMDANSPTPPLLRVGSFSRPREKAGDEGAAHRADPLGSFSRTREKAGDEGVAHCADPHPNPLPRAGEGVESDPLVLYGETFASRLLLGTSRYPSPAVLHSAVQRAQPAMLTASLRREGAGSGEGNGGRSFWQLLQTLGLPVLPNTAGCHSADEVFTTAQMAREVFDTPWIKLELIGDDYTLQPDTLNLVEAARRLIRDGFKVLPYCTEDLVLCQRLVDAGCQAVMPWAAPIGTGKGPVNPYAMRLLRERLSVPLIVDAGLGLPSHACQVMEWGFDAVLLNTAVALAQDPVAMAGAFADGVRAGRSAFLAGAMREQHAAQPSTPVLGTPFWHEA